MSSDRHYYYYNTVIIVLLLVLDQHYFLPPDSRSGTITILVERGIVLESNCCLKEGKKEGRIN